MSTATQKPFGETIVPVPTFSYAQAAKGRSPSAPLSLAGEKTSTVGSGPDTRPLSTNASEGSTSPSDKTATKRAVSESRMSLGRKNGGDPVTEQADQPNFEPAATPAAATPATQESGQSQVLISTPSSPDFGMTSTSTFPKDDDMFSTANASSDSTWEKLSQSSQSGNKPSGKKEAPKETTSNMAWDEEAQALPAPPPLKDAPLPAVNFWKQRAEAQAAKQSINPQSSKTSAQGNGHVISNGAPKIFDIGVESRKQDSRKQVKRIQADYDDRSPTSSSKVDLRPVEGKAKGEEPGQRSSQKAPRVPDTLGPSNTPMAPPPPPGDAVSWPLPDSAQIEEKKKAQERAERGEKEKAPMPKHHSKEKWMPVPYVPSVQFNTPLPPVRRGGARASRGGRDSGPRGNSSGNSTEKPPVTSTNPSGSPNSPNNEHGKMEGIHPRNTFNSSKPKRSSSAGPTIARDQRKASDAAAPEKRKESDFGVHKAQIGVSNSGPRRVSVTGHNGSWQYDVSTSKGAPTDFSRAPGPGGTHTFREAHDQQPSSFDLHSHPRSSVADQRTEGNFRPIDYSKDFHNPTSAHREGRSERGRGGYRSRGAGNHTFANSNQANGQGYPNESSINSQWGPPPLPSKSHSNHERRPSQLQHPGYQPPLNHGRSFRSGSRSQSIPHSASFGRYPQGSHVHSGHHLPSLQTDVANQWGYQPGNQGIMSANPYNTYMEQMSIFGMVSMQMEYYFSVDNLCKDLFLRKHMDSQGFVFLSVLTKFRRIQQLTQDIELIRLVCMHSALIEICAAPDGYDRLRKREGWQQWVLAIDERDPSARNDGPSQLLQPRFQQTPIQEGSYSIEDHQMTLPRFSGPGVYNHTEAVAAPYTLAAASREVINGNTNDTFTSQAPSTAAVSDFAPGITPTNPEDFLPAESFEPMESTFTDEQVDGLMILVRKQYNSSASVPPPFHTASSRTFSNGSIDSRTITNEHLIFDERQNLASTGADSIAEK